MEPPHDDDAQVGRILTRREVLGSLGIAGAAMLTPYRALLPVSGAHASGRLGSGAHASGRLDSAVATGPVGLPACVARPEQTEGPYFVDEKLDRSDIRSDPSDGSIREGVPMRLAFHVSRLEAGSCLPLSGALVDVWQCDALGIYSGVRDVDGLFDTSGKKFLRGHQMTDAGGKAEFTTVYPGWYPGRTVHVHFKIRTDPDSARGYEFTSQLYFDDAVTDEVHARQPYAGRGRRSTQNPGDSLYRRGGSQLMLSLAPFEKGYAGTFDVGLRMT